MATAPSNSEDRAPVSRSGAPLTLPELRIIGDCHVSIWGLSARERQVRAFVRSGAAAERHDQSDAPHAATASAPAAAPASASLILIGPEWVLSPDVIRGLAGRTGILFITPGVADGPGRVAAAHLPAGASEDAVKAASGWISGHPPSTEQAASHGLKTVRIGDISSAYDHVLRKRADAFAYSLLETPLDEIERKTFAGSYKGVTDFVTKFFWPRPARVATRWAADLGISPNTVTTLSLVLVIIANVQFAYGWYLSGIAVAWAMTFLDTVDGKLARVTLTSSKWGNIYDHGIDLIHPPFWWAAWWWSLKIGASPEMATYLDWAFWIICAGYVVDRLQEGWFIHRFGFHIHVWRPIESFFRLYTARRNPNLAILMIATLLGQPALGFLAVAAWTVFCIVFHMVGIAQAEIDKARGREIRSWLEA